MRAHTPATVRVFALRERLDAPCSPTGLRSHGIVELSCRKQGISVSAIRLPPWLQAAALPLAAMEQHVAPTRGQGFASPSCRPPLTRLPPPNLPCPCCPSRTTYKGKENRTDPERKPGRVRSSFLHPSRHQAAIGVGAPLRGAEQRRGAGGSRLALSEPQASLASRPARRAAQGSCFAATSAKQPAHRGRLLLGYFFLAKQEEVTRASGVENSGRGLNLTLPGPDDLERRWQLRAASSGRLGRQPSRAGAHRPLRPLTR
jgi:hypothetical protein